MSGQLPARAWLAPSAEPTAAVPGRPYRADELDASIQQALRRLYEALAGDPDDLAGLPADIERAWVAGGGAGWPPVRPEVAADFRRRRSPR